jgi:predicted ATPase/class 3 adenylate cyclase
MASTTAGPLPTGTVTFLFTDIEGSTQLLTRSRERYEEALAAHTELLGTAIAAHAGRLVSTAGDAIFAVFPSAVDAVTAAAQAQHALAAHAWPDDATIRVRMGLHTGEGRLGGSDYVGMDVHRAARIAAAGHGGQVVVSDATRVLVAHELEAGLALVDLGQHRLKDLPAPEELWQLTIEGLTSEFPALRSLDARPSNLPVSLTALIGREGELREVADLLSQRRLVTLTGPGGTGKTRLALAVAQHLLPEFADGAWFVGLEEARDRGGVLGAIAAALGVRERADRDLEQGIRQYLGSRELLLVLDNFEQVVEAAPLVSELLAAAPGLRVIVTSRAVLRLSGEQDFEVPPLAIPDLAALPSLPALSQYHAVALFIERARAVRSNFEVTNENAPAVAEICSRLDGLPLAIELAAARVRLLAPQAILDRLERRLPLLTGGTRDLPDRQRTLRGAIDWSYELLEEPERRLFTRLAVFAGGWTLDAAAAVCDPAGELGIETLDGLMSLAEKSLVRARDEDGDEPRFGMYQVIREFAAERLEGEPDAEAVHHRHAERMLMLAEAAGPELERTEMRRWQGRLRREEENLRTAIRWSIDRGEAELGLRMAGRVWRFWHYWGHVREGVRWFEALLALPGAAEPTLGRARALSGLAALLYWQGESDRAAELYEEALAIRRRLGDEREVAEALLDTAWGAVARSDIAAASARAAEALEGFRRVGDSARVAHVTAWLTTMPFVMGVGGDATEALAAAREAAEVNREAGRLFEATDWLGGIGRIHYMAGDYAAALRAMREAIGLFHAMGYVGLAPLALKFMARVELFFSGGDPRRAVRLAAAAERYFDEIGGQLAMLEPLGDPLGEARALLSEDEHARAMEEGLAMSLEVAVAYAMETRLDVAGG